MIKINGYIMELGTKVLCKGYMKKTNNYIHNDKLEQQNLCRKLNRKFIESESGFYDNLGNPIDWEGMTKVMDFVEKEFVGYICGKRRLNVEIYPTVEYISYTGEDREVVYKNWESAINCYEVCVENKNHSWGKRWVPVDKLEVYDNE